MPGEKKEKRVVLEKKKSVGPVKKTKRALVGEEEKSAVPGEVEKIGELSLKSKLFIGISITAVCFDTWTPMRWHGGRIFSLPRKGVHCTCIPVHCSFFVE